MEEILIYLRIRVHSAELSCEANMMMKIVYEGLWRILEAGSFNKMISHFSNKDMLERKGRVWNLTTTIMLKAP